MKVSPPVGIIECERVWMRQCEAGDAAALLIVLGDPAARQYFPEPLTKALVVNWIESNRQRYRENDGGLWAMILKETGEVIGDYELIRRGSTDGVTIEAAYHVRVDMRGRGYATEATRCCSTYAFKKLDADEVSMFIRADNLASRRVAEKNGFRVVGEIMRAGSLHLVYMIKREDWDADTQRIT